MRPMRPLIPHKQHHRRRNRYVTCNKIPPIERLLKSRESLNRQNKNIQKKIKSVNPDTAKDAERISFWTDALFLIRRGHGGE